MPQCRLFLLDDHRVFLEGLAGIVNSNPKFTVLQSFDRAADMLDALKFEQPDIIISDISLPGMDGIEAAKEALNLYPKMHFIFLTMHADGVNARRAMDAGGKGYLLKDSTSEEVFEAIRTVCEGGNYISARVTQSLLETTAQVLDLSPREKEILRSLASGKSTKEIADALNLSSHTIDTHRKSLLAKSGCNNVGHLVAWGVQRGYIEL